ncbi:hypothetical protein [Mycobacterium sp. JS623]|nr:hypothetical protein [Mycobacterium sp. JS623]
MFCFGNLRAVTESVWLLVVDELQDAATEIDPLRAAVETRHDG